MKSFYSRNGKVKPVKNLGWLRRYASNNIIRCIVISKKPIFLQVFFEDKTVYFSEFADYSVLVNWIDRPIFKGCEVHLINQ